MGPVDSKVREEEDYTEEEIKNDPNKKVRVEITKRLNDYRKKYLALLKKSSIDIYFLFGLILDNSFSFVGSDPIVFCIT